jgi:hypothetical protein
MAFGASQVVGKGLQVDSIRNASVDLSSLTTR